MMDEPESNPQPQSQPWMLDTMAPFHHTSDRQLLNCLQEKAAYQQPVVGREHLQILGHGSVETERYKVPDVRYVAGGDTMNTISVYQLAKNHGLVSVFEPTACQVKVSKAGQIVGEGRQCDGKFLLDYLLVPENCVQERKEEEAGMEHKEEEEKRKKNEKNKSLKIHASKLQVAMFGTQP
ncbi:hypothetical protein ACP70R_008692 [Stipagrostis hirtigluma subsp. patula]